VELANKELQEVPDKVIKLLVIESSNDNHGMAFNLQDRYFIMVVSIYTSTINSLMEVFLITKVMIKGIIVEKLEVKH
jgi:hypothetical protein